MPFSGHFPQVLGDDAENDFSLLLRTLGYTIVRRRNLTPGIDFVADFTEHTAGSSRLIRPLFSPSGRTAFSVKRGDFTDSDVETLRRYVREAHESNDPTLRAVTGAVLVAGTLLTEPRLNDLKTRDVYCWDIRRLIFYAYKAKVIAEPSLQGPIKEYSLRHVSGTFLVLPLRTRRTVMDVRAYIFVDDHNLMIQRDHMIDIMEELYQVGFRQSIIDPIGYNVNASLSIHSVGPIQSQLVDEAYREFSGASERHNGALFNPTTSIEIQSYGGAPWTAIFRT